MSKKENFNSLVDKAMEQSQWAHLRPVIEKELLHYDIFFALDKENLLDALTFQGGTCLRLCYGSSRFSEDLDFAGGRDFTTGSLLEIKSCIEKYIGDRYGLEVMVKEPQAMKKEKKYQEINVDKWQISVTTAPEKKDLPKQKIRIEIASVPAYSQAPRSLQTNYNFLPDSYSNVLILTETLDEILADKLIAFVNCQKYVRYRDIWDLRWLKQKGASINAAFIQNKIKDYSIVDYSEKLKETLVSLESIIYSAEFYKEMSRFLSMEVLEQTLRKEKFKLFLFNEIKSLLQAIQPVV